MGGSRSKESLRVALAAGESEPRLPASPLELLADLGDLERRGAIALLDQSEGTAEVGPVHVADTRPDQDVDQLELKVLEGLGLDRVGPNQDVEPFLQLSRVLQLRRDVDAHHHVGPLAEGGEN